MLLTYLACEKTCIKLLSCYINYVTDKIVRVALTMIVRMLMCVQTICEEERAGEID